MNEAIKVEESASRKWGWLSGWKILKRLLLVGTFLGLGSLNILTLLDEQAHALGYRAIASILGTAVTDATLSKLLSNSPSMRRKQDVDVATRSLKASADTTALQHRVLIEKHAALERTHQETAAKHAELKTSYVKRAESVQRVSQKLSTRAVLGASRNLTSIPAETIPYFGVAIVLGITAMDIYDACETIRDINKLNVEFGQPEQDETKVCGMKVPSREEAISQIKGNWQSAYRTTAGSITQFGSTVSIPELPPTVGWADIKGTVCPVIANAFPGC